MVEIFDKHDVSFVSITQQFNTTSSMGRLTLNVLLSFAQFEREVTGERIRDKIAASKKKGMWMGGNVALGYDVIDRKLIVSNEIKIGSPSHRREIVIQVVNRVMLTEQAVRIALNLDGLRTVLGLPASPEKGHAHIIDIGAEIRSRGVELKLIINDPSTDCGSRRVPALIRAVIRANDWWHRLSSGESRSIATLARNEGLNDRYVSRHLPLAFLAPDITEAILDGQQPADLSLEALFKGRPIPVSWTEQRRIYRFR